MPRKIRVRIKIKPYIKRVKTRHGKKQRVIKAHKRTVIRNFDRLQGKEEMAKEFFVSRFGKSPEQNPRKFDRWRRSLIKEKKNILFRNPIRVHKRFVSDDQIRKRAEIILLGSDTLHPFEARQKAINELIREGIIKRSRKKTFGSFGGIRDIKRFRDINRMILKRKESILMGSDTLSPETARKIAKDQLVTEGKIKKSELKNRGSSPTTGTAKPSDTLLFETIQKNKKLKQRSEFKKKFGIDLDEIEDLSNK